MNAAAGNSPEIHARYRRYFEWALLGICLICLVPRLLLGISQYIEYDGYWHIWIARQDRWDIFIREYQANAHPPLYFLLQKLTLWFGATNLTYRSISLISGIASVYLLGKTALKAMRSPVWAGIAALAYGLALPSIVVSNEVRTYMLSALLVQISFYYFLDLSSMKARVIFATTAALACLTEYYALIYVGAALLFTLIRLILVRLKAHRVRLKPDREPKFVLSLLREFLTFALILALPVWEFAVHFGSEIRAYDHLPTFYFQPDGPESAIEFLLRNLLAELNCFSPWVIPQGTTFYIVLAALIASLAGIIFLARPTETSAGRQSQNAAALAILLLPLFMMAAIMTGGLLRVYPFGGFLRQQYVLFPFLATCPFLLFDRLTHGKMGLILAAVLAIGIAGVSVRNYQALPKNSQLLMSDQMRRYNRMFPAADGIYIDQFNLTTFFMHHHDWKWDFVAPLPSSDTVDVYRLSRDGRSMFLFRDRDHWNLDLRDPTLYSQMARGMRTWKVHSMTIFDLAQPGGRARTQAQVTAYRNRAAELSAAEDLCIETLDLDNYDVYAEFRAAGTCSSQ